MGAGIVPGCPEGPVEELCEYITTSPTSQRVQTQQLNFHTHTHTHTHTQKERGRERQGETEIVHLFLVASQA